MCSPWSSLVVGNWRIMDPLLFLLFCLSITGCFMSLLSSHYWFTTYHRLCILFRRLSSCSHVCTPCKSGWSAASALWGTVWAETVIVGGLYSAPLIPARIRSPVKSSGIKFGRKACYFFHSGVLLFWWNLGIPELRLECSMEFAGTECNKIQLFVCLVHMHMFVDHMWHVTTVTTWHTCPHSCPQQQHPCDNDNTNINTNTNMNTNTPPMVPSVGS